MSGSDDTVEDITSKIIKEFLEILKKDKRIDKQIVAGLSELIKDGQIRNHKRIIDLIESGGI
jgi:ribosomal protein L19E